MDTEYSIKLRLEKLPRYQLSVIFCVAIGLFAICGLVAAFLSPPIISSHAVDIYKCVENISEMCYSNTTTHEVWSGSIPSTSRLNQLLYMTVTPYSKKDIIFNMTMEILVTHQFKILADNQKTALITCKDGNCNTVVIFYLPYLEYENYRVIIRHKSQILSDMVEINLSYVDSLYSKYQLATKYTFLVLSLLSFVNFLMHSCKVPMRLWSFEAKLLLFLGPSLIVFNEPLLALTIYYMNPVWSAVSVFCNVQFLAVLFLFWQFSLQNYRKISYRKLYISLEILVVSALSGLIFTGYLYVHQKLRFDPTYDWQSSLTENYKEIYIAVLGLLTILACWILFLACRALKSLWKFTIRQKVMMSVNVIFIGLGFAGVAIGAFQPIPKYSSLLLLYESGFNLYVILLEFMYSPTSGSLLEYQNDKKIQYTLVKYHESDDSIEMAYNN